jgi:hypothetical protein
MAEMSHGDVVQLYHDTICTYKGSPVRVTDIDRELNVTFIMLRHGKSAKAKFDADLFGPPLARIGFVNEGTHCVFVTRQPVRRFQVGLNRGNVKLHSMPFTDRKAAERDYNLVYRMNTKGWAKALDNEYPTLAEALRIVTLSVVSTTRLLMWVTSHHVCLRLSVLYLTHNTPILIHW